MLQHIFTNREKQPPFTHHTYRTHIHPHHTYRTHLHPHIQDTHTPTHTGHTHTHTYTTHIHPHIQTTHTPTHTGHTYTHTYRTHTHPHIHTHTHKRTLHLRPPPSRCVFILISQQNKYFFLLSHFMCDCLL